MKILLSSLALCLMLGSSAAHASGIADNKDVQSFIAEMVKKHGFKKDWLTHLFEKADIKENIIKTMNRPAEQTMTWQRYRNIFLKEKRINDGAAFYKENRQVFDAVAKKFNIPSEIVLAIMGVETFYGQRTGGHRVIDALATLSFSYPKRANFFRKELEQLLLLVREESIDPFSVQGSYAGAIGKPQFMPSSYREYAVDFDGDGQRDLQNSVYDTVASIANYLKKHGWQKDGAIIHLGNATHLKESYKAYLDKGLKPSIPFKNIEESGITLDSTIPMMPETLVSLFQMDAENGQEYWVGEHNFYVITRYNHSPLYALAVVQLAEAIKHTLTHNKS